MSSSTALPSVSAIFPNLPRESQVVTPATGEFIPVWSLWAQQMNQALQRNFTPTGVLIPSQPTAYFSRPIGAATKGTIVYDSESNNFMGNVNGHWKTFTLV